MRPEAGAAALRGIVECSTARQFALTDRRDTRETRETREIRDVRDQARERGERERQRCDLRELSALRDAVGAHCIRKVLEVAQGRGCVYCIRARRVLGNACHSFGSSVDQHMAS